jgi:diaminopimelate decarboxylase
LDLAVVLEVKQTAMNGLLNNSHTPADSRKALGEIVRRYGTPTYAFDVQRLQSQVEKLRNHLPSEIEILYSLKANASLGICDVFAQSGIGADVASAGEFETAIAAGFAPEQIFVAGPFKLPETIERLRDFPTSVVSVDSFSELKSLSDAGLQNPAVLRLRPDFGSCAVVQAGSESRFGFTCSELDRCRDFLPTCQLHVIGFHVFAGSQVLDTDKLNEQLRKALDLSLRAAETLEIEPTYINLGGGFGIGYGPNDVEVDLAKVGDEMTELVRRAAPARMVLELGRYLVAESGWYLTSVVGHQTFQGQPAVVVDGGVHQRADMCGLCLRSNQVPPLVLAGEVTSVDQTESQQPDDKPQLTPTAVLGCLSLPDDVLIESCPLPKLAVGDVLAFRRAGAYGLWSSAALFHSSPLPAEVAFDESTIHLMRERKPASSILENQHHIGESLGDSLPACERPAYVK